MRAEWRQLLRDGCEPLTRVCHMRWIVEPAACGCFCVACVRGIERGIAAFEPVCGIHFVFGPFEQPAGVASVPPLVQDFGSGAGNQLETLLRDHREESAEIAAGICMAVKIEFAFLRFVPIPGDVKVNRIDALCPVYSEQRFPLVAWNAVVEK